MNEEGGAAAARVVWDSGYTFKAGSHQSLDLLSPPSQVLVAESFGGRDEPVDTLLTSLVDVGAEVRGCVGGGEVGVKYIGGGAG